jgi:hypothetical protein
LAHLLRLRADRFLDFAELIRYEPHSFSAEVKHG